MLNKLFDETAHFGFPKCSQLLQWTLLLAGTELMPEISFGKQISDKLKCLNQIFQIRQSRTETCHDDSANWVLLEIHAKDTPTFPIWGLPAQILRWGTLPNAGKNCSKDPSSTTLARHQITSAQSGTKRVNSSSITVYLFAKSWFASRKITIWEMRLV